MFVVLAAGVAAMGVALFKPVTTPSLSKDGFRPPARLKPANRFEEPTAAAKNYSPKGTSSSSNSAISEMKTSKLDSEPKLLVASGPSSLANGATVVSPAKQTPVSLSVTPVVVGQMASMHIRVEHRFAAAQVLIWADDKLIYKESMDGTVKRRMRMFKTVEGYKSDAVQLASGEHRIRVRVQSADNSYDRTGTIMALVPEEGERELKIDCTNRKQIRLTVE